MSKQYEIGMKIMSDKTTIPDEHRYIVQVVIDNLEQNKGTMTYGDVSKGVCLSFGVWIPPVTLGEHLGYILDYCKAVNLPGLSAMIVNQKTSKPGNHFISRYRSNYPNKEDICDDEIIEHEQQAVLQCESWEALYDYVGIDETAPLMREREDVTQDERAYQEGLRISSVIRNEIQRSAKARAHCLEKRGYRCAVCEKDSEEVYGVHGIIHVHHQIPLSRYEGKRMTDADEDLIPVCPNCHAVIHSKGKHDCYSVNEVRAMLGLPPLKEFLMQDEVSE